MTIKKINHRSRLRLMLLGGLVAGNAAAQSCTPYPQTFAQDFYRSSYSFFNASPERVSAVVTPELLRKLQDERACVIRNGRCHLQYDPWLGPQDGAIGRPLQFRSEAQDAHSAVIVMSYPADGTAPGTPPRSVSLKLRRDVATACWQLDDFITPSGESVSMILGGGKP